MSASRLASTLAAAAGLVWIVAAVAGWGVGAQRSFYLVGLAGFMLAMAATGYAVVSSAPVWLRGVVTLATPALGYMVWVTMRAAFGADYLPTLIAGVGLVVAGAVGFTRSPRRRPQPATRGRRALR